MKSLSRKRHDELTLARDETRDPLARRDFMKLMGAALGLAGVEGCTRAPSQEIVPYVVQPPEVKPGKPRFYSSALTLDGYATGVLVESHEGRPTKIEGNPDHVASLGASGVFEQAQVLSLYDPHRARGTKERGAGASWDSVREALTSGAWTARDGRGLHFVLEPTSSPSVGRLLEAIRKKWPAVGIHFHAAASRANAWAGARQAFGRVVEPRHELGHADVIVALDADFLASGPAHLRLARAFADGRRLGSPSGSTAMNRLYAVEALVTVTGATADHRLRVRPHDVARVAAALLAAVGGTSNAPSLGPAEQRFVGALARDLLAHRGRSVVIAGDAQPPAVHAAAHALNALLGNEGQAVRYGACPIFEAGEPSHSLTTIRDTLDRGEVDTLVIAGTNIGYAAPELRVSRARQSAYAGLYEDETAAACTYSVALAHSLESWGDARAFDGTVSVVQPLIEPLFGGRTLLEVLAIYTDLPPITAHAMVRERFDSDAAWRDALRRGVVASSASPDLAVTAAPAVSFGAFLPAGPLEVVFPLDLRVHDGRFTDNAWLLELPASITKLTWENAATLAPETAAPLGILDGDELSLTWEGRTVIAPALVVPGQAAGTVGLALGWGRSAGGALGSGYGTSAYLLRGAAAPWIGRGVTLAKTGARRELAFTQKERSLQGRDDAILHHTTLAEHRKNPKAGAKDNKRPLPLYDVRPGPAPHQWGMAIDLSICTGCTACVVACQAENNVPVVGRDGVSMGRAMHWIRIDSYFDGDLRDPTVLSQPMLCQHCEKAPCEYVCPVNATVHSTEGLNEMVYNRCVGTRFCSNNCPYKVRRFNWFDFHHDETETEQLVHNPDVTVRERGVMEKCTFCVQRIREHEIHDQIGAPDRAPLQTACQQACPTRAITFGDVGDPSSSVSKLHGDDRAFAALNDLGTVPRVRYLARIKNPNPELL